MCTFLWLIFTHSCKLCSIETCASVALVHKAKEIAVVALGGRFVSLLLNQSGSCLLAASVTSTESFQTVPLLSLTSFRGFDVQLPISMPARWLVRDPRNWHWKNLGYKRLVKRRLNKFPEEGPSEATYLCMSVIAGPACFICKWLTRLWTEYRTGRGLWSVLVAGLLSSSEHFTSPRSPSFLLWVSEQNRGWMDGPLL